MKRILAIVDAVYPNLTMNGVIAANILDVIRDSYDIKILALRRSDDDLELAFGNEIIYIKSYAYYEKQLYHKLETTRGIYKLFLKGVLLGVRCSHLLLRILSPYGLNGNLIKKYEKLIKNQYQEEKFDYIFLISVPFEPMVALEKIAAECINTKIIYYQVDDFVDGNDTYYPKLLWKRRKKQRIRISQKASSLFYKHFMLESVLIKEGNYYKDLNVKGIGLPLLIKREYNKSEVISSDNKEEKKYLVYTGSLTIGGRTPVDCLKIFKIVVSLQKNTVVKFFHRGDCAGIVEEYGRLSNGCICNFGEVSSEESYREMNKADFLVSISTKDGDQISGKTFDYISTGKPIIFFYYKDNDVNLRIYSQYDLCLTIKMQDSKIEQNARKVIDFIDSECGKSIEFSHLKQKFESYIPEKIVEELFSEG